MKEKLTQSLVREGYLKTPIIIEAFKHVDRAHFVPDEIKRFAYINEALPIGHGQTISQPLTVAFLLELLEPRAGDKILDIGTGSGWQAALLIHALGKEGKVISIERIPELKVFAEKNLSHYEAFREGRLRVVEGNGREGYREEAPYDKIIAAAAGDAIPEPWKEQLKIGGRIVAPVGDSVILLQKTAHNEYKEKRYFGFSFVPLVP